MEKKMNKQIEKKQKQEQTRTNKNENGSIFDLVVLDFRVERPSPIKFNQEMIEAGTGLIDSNFHDQFKFSVSLNMGGSLTLRENEEGNETESEVKSVHFIPFYYFISYKLARAVVDGVYPDHSGFQNWSDEEKSDIVAMSQGAPKSGICRTRGNFDISGYENWLDDREKKKRLRSRVSIVGYSLEKERKGLIIFRFGGSAIKNVIDYVGFRQSEQVAFWYYPCKVSARSEKNEDRTYFVPTFTPIKDRPVITKDEQALIFHENIVSPLIEVYKRYAKGYEEFVPSTEKVTDGYVVEEEQDSGSLNIPNMNEDDIPF